MQHTYIHIYIHVNTILSHLSWCAMRVNTLKCVHLFKTKNNRNNLQMNNVPQRGADTCCCTSTLRREYEACACAYFTLTCECGLSDASRCLLEEVLDVLAFMRMCVFVRVYASQ